MFINENLVITPAHRYVEGLGLSIGTGVRLRHVQANHHAYSGTPIISSSVFISASETSHLEHMYTTFWTHDTCETYYSTAFLARICVLDTPGQIPLSPAVGHDRKCWLETDDGFMKHLLYSSPLFFSAVFRGRHLHPDVFGEAVVVPNGISRGGFLNPTAINCHMVDKLMAVPLGSFRQKFDERLPMHYDYEHSGDLHTKDTFRNEAHFYMGLLGMIQMLRVGIPAQRNRSISDTEVCLTTDRYLAIRGQSYTNDPVWVGIDLMTLPFYHILTELSLTVRPRWL